MELFKANAQWSTRPVDERFASLQALYDVTKNYADQAKEKEVPFADIRVEARGEDVELVGKANVPARLTHWAFGQLCARVAAPASYLRELPATLAAQNINHGLKARVAEFGTDAIAKLMFHSNGGLLLRALTSERYERIWNYEVAERLLDLEGQGWEPAVPDRTWEDSQVGITALYASDHDMFAFIRSKNAVIAEAGSDQPIYKGVIVENSEVGASALKLTRFLYRYMCGNHIIWGAEEVSDVSLRHVGTIRDKFYAYSTVLRRYANESVSDIEAKIKQSKTRLIAATKEEVLDALFGKRSIGLSRKALEASYAAVDPVDGDARTPWGIAQGVTRYSQTVKFADKRTDLDRAAGRILDSF